MLNAKTCRKWILDHYAAKGVDVAKEAGKIVNSHFCACSTNLPETAKFGISDEERVFAFWDWVGGRFSVSSCIGILALSFHFGYDYMRGFLDGMHSIDQNVPYKNILLFHKKSKIYILVPKNEKGYRKHRSFTWFGWLLQYQYSEIQC